MDLTEISYEYINWTELVQDRIKIKIKMLSLHFVP
jgi:hypothetical protein